MEEYLDYRRIKDNKDYIICNNGKVWSIKRKIFLKTRVCNIGYVRVNINKKCYTIHRLLATHFIDNPENKEEVDHINRDKKDNRISNLRWVSVRENRANKGDYKRNKNKEPYIYEVNTTKGKVWRISIQKNFNQENFSLEEVKKIRDILLKNLN